MNRYHRVTESQRSQSFSSEFLRGFVSLWCLLIGGNMKKVVILVLCILTVTFAVNKNLTQTKTTLVDDNKPITPNTALLTSNSSLLTPYSSPLTSNPFLPLIGRVEVIGGTSYDWINGPASTWCVSDTFGIHTTWMWSNSNDPFADRNMKYNFYDWTTRTWNYNIGASYMSYGLDAFTHTLSSVAGGADMDPITGNFVICGQYTPTGLTRRPKLARDAEPGAGLFEYSESPPTWYWPFIAVDHNQAIHLAVICSTAPNETLYYSRVQPWGTWASYTRVCPPFVEPLGPTQNIQASHTSNKVIITWTNWRTAPRIDSGYYRFSNNGGITWDAPVALPFPPSTLDSISFNISGLFAHFDQNDNFHLVGALAPAGLAWPSEIWHYCPVNNPAWSRIFLRDYDTLAGGVGYNTLAACHPSITRNPSNNYLYVAWEVMDSLNIEPLTGYTRADIYVAESRDNGLTWPAKVRITDPGTAPNWNTTSKRFPVAGGVQVTPSTSDPDTLIVMYLVDSIAGALVQTEHRFCVNPYVVHRVPVPLSVAIEEENPSPKYYNFTLKPAIPNPTKFNTNIYYSLPTTGKVDLTIYDVLGRPIKTLFSGTNTPGEYNIIWDGTDNNRKKVQAGIYFYTLKTLDKSISRKLIRTN